MRSLALAGAFCASACGTDFDHLKYAPVGGVPDGVLLQPTLVSLPAGVSVAARVVAVKDNGLDMPCEPTLTSDNDTVLSVERADRGTTVFTGVSPGSTAILVHCGDEDGSIEGRVTAAP